MMTILSRTGQFRALYPDAPAFRLRQFEAALYDPALRSFSDISNMPLAMREALAARVSWLALKPVQVLESAKKDTHKAIVELGDGTRVETVLMRNARGQWTVCVSSQVGCAMACTFCATGAMGFARNLIADEIADQVRFWLAFLKKQTTLSSAEGSGRISNVVFMGMGEPLANYDNVKEAVSQLLAHTDIGPTHITVSTVGLLPMLRKLLKDPDWPPVRLAVSLHSAVSETRKAMMPTSFDTFLEDLIAWTEEYFERHESRRRHLTFEYVMLSKVNDTEQHAEALIRFARRVGKVRINLIPYNFTGSVYRDSLPADFARFEKSLKDAGVTVTRRRTMGDDIAAACGQLIVAKNKQ
ncbi:MAG: 23S rRNA (adenine(2503)-C(2))-methyltransferase RlmN [Patescibacteria group bacterium]